jgi:hypothetical protein
VKQTRIIFLLAVFMASAFGNRSFAYTQKTGNGSPVLSSGSYSSSALFLLNAEIESCVIQGAGGGQHNSGFQKLPGTTTTEPKNNGSRLYLLSLGYSTPDHLRVKQYLSHIYPFHNFW